jgi:hypothetical protein
LFSRFAWRAYHQCDGPPSPSSPASFYLSGWLWGNWAHQYFSTDGQTVQFVAILNDTFSDSAALQAIPGLRTAISQVATSAGAVQSGVLSAGCSERGAQRRVLSANAFAYDITQISTSDLSRIIPTAAPWSAWSATNQNVPAPLVVGAAIAALALLVIRPLRWK